MTDILLSDADLTHAGNVTVYDMAMCTSQMLSCMEVTQQDTHLAAEETQSAGLGPLTPNGIR